ncbi:MAG: sugar isomerase domain-containing protein [Opitutaceae bacterium]|nr:sugar isomerase domain-containing protein [Opitutaceae bacterium]
MSEIPTHYLSTAQALLQKAVALNAPVLAQLGRIIGESVARGGVLHTFGSGHSEIISREIIGRAGGLVCVSGIFDPTGGFAENLVGYGTKIVERYDRAHGLLPGETVIVISNSGKNSSPLEVALYAKRKGLNVVGLTCVAMSATAPTVHPDGRKLHEIADHVLDNCGLPGDAITPVADGVMAGPTSTFIGATLLNLLSLEIIAWLKAGGHPLPILRSQNLPDAIEYNRALGRQYKGRLSRQLA